MPIDMTLPLCLSKEDFLSASPPQSRDPMRRFERPAHHSARKTKKRVTFADHRGLALTRVKVFSEFNDPIDIPASVREMLSSAAVAAVAPQDKLELDFAQPSSDYLRFRQSLETNLVSLERCVLKEHAFAGTVKVKNVSFEKRVKLRVSFDAWTSHADVDCAYVRDAYPAACSDTFSFEVPLPTELPPHRPVEFAVCYAVGGREHWDSNHGNNYSIVWSSARSRRAADACGSCSDPAHFGVHLDRYGSPTCSHGIFPDWPSYAGYENIGPYY